MHLMYFMEQLLFLEVGCGAPITVMGAQLTARPGQLRSDAPGRKR